MKKMTKKKQKQERLAVATEAANQLGDVTSEQLTFLEELTDKQKVIVRFKMRGLSQKAIANVLNCTPARVSQEMKAIRAHHVALGSAANQAALVGETVSLYEELEKMAFEVWHDEDTKSLRAIDTIASVREKRMKLLMDLGLIKRAVVEHSHDHTVSPLLQGLTPELRDELAAKIVQTSPGIAPTPPSDDDFEDTEIITA